MAFRIVGRSLARYLSKPASRGGSASTSPVGMLRRALRAGDVLLIEGNTRFSVAIKYLTQSTWSHAALYIGDRPELGSSHCLIEADVIEGVRAVSLSHFEHLHTRICRPVGLSSEETQTLVDFMISRIGYQYDLKNVFDLARYLIQKPPVPEKLRRRLLAFGSGDPTRAVCSTLIAEAFERVSYPILPEIVGERLNDPSFVQTYNEILHIRHHRLYTPRDFDISPYFQIVKPRLESEFDFHRLQWERTAAV